MLWFGLESLGTISGMLFFGGTDSDKSFMFAYICGIIGAAGRRFFYLTGSRSMHRRETIDRRDRIHTGRVLAVKAHTDRNLIILMPASGISRVLREM